MVSFVQHKHWNLNPRPDSVYVSLQKFYDENVIELNCAEDLPDQPFPGLKWADLNMLIYPGKQTTPVFNFGPPQYFDKKDTLFYLRAFFKPEDREKTLYFHIEASNIKGYKKP